MRFPIADDKNTALPTTQNSSPLYLNKPSNVISEVVYDPETGQYVFQEKIGDWNYRNPTVLNSSEYRDYQFKKSVQDYWMVKM